MKIFKSVRQFNSIVKSGEKDTLTVKSDTLIMSHFLLHAADFEAD